MISSWLVLLSSVLGIIFYPWLLAFLWPRYHVSRGAVRAVLLAHIHVAAVLLADSLFWGGVLAVALITHAERTGPPPAAVVPITFIAIRFGLLAAMVRLARVLASA